MRVSMRTKTLSVTAAALMVLSACGGGGDGGGGGGDDAGGGGGGSSEPLQLGYVLPETGQLAFLGPPQIQATKYAISEINAAGGVLGQDIGDLVSGDEADTAAIASQSKKVLPSCSKASMQDRLLHDRGFAAGLPVGGELAVRWRRWGWPDVSGPGCRAARV